MMHRTFGYIRGVWRPMEPVYSVQSIFRCWLHKNRWAFRAHVANVVTQNCSKLFLAGQPLRSRVDNFAKVTTQVLQRTRADLSRCKKLDWASRHPTTVYDLNLVRRQSCE